MSKNFIQYELWKDCRNGCKFCTNFLQKDVDKKESLEFVLKDLDNIQGKDFDLGFIGGEFFDNQLDNDDIKELFYKLFNKTKEKIQQGIIKRLFITVTLIYDIEKQLIPFLNYLKEIDIIDKVVLCTSYDLKYRFYTKEREDLWKGNVKRLNTLYPSIKIHTQIILTSFFIDAVLTNQFNIKEFCKEYNITIDYNEPQSGFYYTKEEMKEKLPDFYPTRSQFINFMNKTILQEHIINPDTFLIRELHADRLYYSFEGKQYLITDRHKKENFYIKVAEGKNQLGFADSDINMADFAAEFLESLS